MEVNSITHRSILNHSSNSYISNSKRGFLVLVACTMCIAHVIQMFTNVKYGLS